jgi:hypothetical protein
MRILISGSTGLVGTAAVQALRPAGHTIHRLVRPGSRRPGDTKDVNWDPVDGGFDAAVAEGTDAVVHLAGASIAEGRWNEARKKMLRSSRVEATRHLVGELTKLRKPPKVFLCASAVGYYGDRGDEWLTEQSAPAYDFLGLLAQDWEAEAAKAAEFGARVVRMRFGVILAKQGGALKKMLLPFKLGAGGPMGSGRQWTSWVSLPDAVAFICHALENERLRGPVNVVSPIPVRNGEFARTLGRVLRRPAMAPFPAFMARLAFGEMAEALLLASQRVLPDVLQRAGYKFQHAELETALRAVLKE